MEASQQMANEFPQNGNLNPVEREELSIPKNELNIKEIMYKDELAFGQFIQSEINDFQTDLLRRKCKRAMLDVLIRYQEMEDGLYRKKKRKTYIE